ncbi:CYFA0S06e01596g1_1 [Cyberlindnera fabianii]|uniref:Inosine triphosphate pyrophosphatase n=1 Tax=Cyberlindnera fabianii TaxID=36022 RepID=A0A061B0F1_CYBFA|nr:Inosine triphosphate pyrophosphatase [Cyberlindnera fabianii]CDR41097.1 CYFA0S06e01596g1_1 [Cyberlindnera fabianii]
MALTFVTGNNKKLREFQAIVQDPTILHQKIDVDEIQGSIEAISIRKAQAAAEIVKGPVLVDDSCVIFNALSKPGIGLPGPYIKFFMDSLGADGLARLLDGFEDKSAKAVCTFAFCEGPGMDVKLFQGAVDGSIASEPRFGEGGGQFGVDAVFVPNGYDLTYSEMKQEMKNRISERSKALQLVKEFLESRKEVIV